ncbi:MAG TPA: cellulase N-terminal Ig-like domain-containing protein, partial [Verrucomicrobiae bacterium]|nr:cellulase N-terminal Ig-like domain-containing protein [Verrucomicrobiae bacterium]
MAAAALGLLLSSLASSATEFNDDSPLAMPSPGAHRLRVLSSDVLELTLITTKQPDPARPTQWDFVEADSQLRMPSPKSFIVSVGDKTISVHSVGFKRRVLYAPLRQRDLRIGNYLYLQLASPIADGQRVEVKNPDATLWPAAMQFTATAEASRWSPAIHVNQAGYLPAFPKKAMVGFYLGSLGELNVSGEPGFKLVEAASGKEVFHGQLVPR